MNRRKVKPGSARLTVYASRSNSGQVRVTEFDWATEALVKPGYYYHVTLPLGLLRDAPILDVSADDPKDTVTGHWVDCTGDRRDACFRRVA